MGFSYENAFPRFNKGGAQSQRIGAMVARLKINQTLKKLVVLRPEACHK
jgi:hypothetical protein